MTNFIKMKNLKEKQNVHHANFVMLKNLKGGIDYEDR